MREAPRSVILLAAVIATATAGARVARADPLALERPGRRQGYYAALGLHGLATSNWDHGQKQGTWKGAGLTLRLGQMLTRRVGIGMAINQASASGDRQKMARFGLGLEGQLVVVDNLALHAGVGLGVATLTDTREPDADTRSAFGSDYTLGASYDLFPGRGRRSGGWALTPSARVRFLPGENVKSLTTFIGLEITYFTGLPKDQLDLPPAEAWQ